MSQASLSRPGRAVIYQLIELLRCPPRASRIDSIQTAERFKKIHTRATKYVQGRKHTSTQTQSLISELQEFQ